MQRPLYQFATPTLLTFIGIPASGKSTIAKHLNASIANSQVFLELPEDQYPEKIKQAFENREHFGYKDIYHYFRSIHLYHLYAAQLRKYSNLSSIVDCYFDKILFSLLEKRRIDYFINSNHRDFPEILNYTSHDAQTIPKADVVVFLKITQKLHNTFLKKRNRHADMGPPIFDTQEAFLEATLEYAARENKPCIILEQEKGIKSITQKLIKQLLSKSIILPTPDQ